MKMNEMRAFNWQSIVNNINSHYQENYSAEINPGQISNKNVIHAGCRGFRHPVEFYNYATFCSKVI